MAWPDPDQKPGSGFLFARIKFKQDAGACGQFDLKPSRFSVAVQTFASFCHWSFERISEPKRHWNPEFASVPRIRSSLPRTLQSGTTWDLGHEPRSDP